MDEPHVDTGLLYPIAAALQSLVDNVDTRDLQNSHSVNIKRPRTMGAVLNGRQPIVPDRHDVTE